MNKKNPYALIKQRVVNEKASTLEKLKDLESNKSLKRFKKAKYVFFVDVKANKIEIKKAIEEIYDVQVDSVNTINVKPKKKMFKRRVGKTKHKKKAIVTLKEGSIIEDKKGK